jgi:hypothetical protein
MAKKTTPTEQFDPKKVKEMQQRRAIGQQEGAADRNDGRRTRMQQPNRIRK